MQRGRAERRRLLKKEKKNFTVHSYGPGSGGSHRRRHPECREERDYKNPENLRALLQQVFVDKKDEEEELERLYDSYKIDYDYAQLLHDSIDYFYESYYGFGLGPEFDRVVDETAREEAIELYDRLNSECVGPF